MHDVEAGHPVEDFAGKMVRPADAGGAVEQLARLRLRERHVVLERRRGHRRMHHQHHGVAREQGNRRKILERVIAEHRTGVRRDDHRRFGRRQQRVTVGIRLCDQRRADTAGRAGAVLDHERLAERRLQMRLQQPRHDIGAAAGGERHDDAHRPVGIGGFRSARPAAVRWRRGRRARRGGSIDWPFLLRRQSMHRHYHSAARVAAAAWRREALSMNSRACRAHRSGSTAAM